MAGTANRTTRALGLAALIATAVTVYLGLVVTLPDQVRVTHRPAAEFCPRVRWGSALVTGWEQDCVHF